MQQQDSQQTYQYQNVASAVRPSLQQAIPPVQQSAPRPQQPAPRPQQHQQPAAQHGGNVQRNSQPQAQQNATPPTQQRNAPASAQQQPKEKDGGGFWEWLATPVGSGKTQPGAINPAERIIYGVGGFGMWAFGAFLTSVFMQTHVPAFATAGKAGVSGGAFWAGVASSLLFMLIELGIWKGRHNKIKYAGMIMFLLIDITINVVGAQSIFGISAGLNLNSFGGIFAFAVGLGAALVPEWFISLAFRK